MRNIIKKILAYCDRFRQLRHSLIIIYVRSFRTVIWVCFIAFFILYLWDMIIIYWLMNVINFTFIL